MRKSVFHVDKVTSESVARLSELGVTALFTAPENVDDAIATELNQAGLSLYIMKSLFEGEAWWKRFPDSRPIGRDGKPLEVAAGWYHGVCPTHPGVRARLLQEVDELLGRKHLSGISLNFLRFPGYWEAARGRDTLMNGCTCERCRSLYGKEPAGPDWERWKAAQITEFTRQIAALRDNHEPRIPLGLHLVPWEDQEHDGARPGALGQDLAQLKQFLDYVSPMCFFGLQGRPPEWLGSMVRWTKRATGKAVIPVVQAFDVTDGDFAAALSTALAPPSDGAIAFAWELMREQEGKTPVLEQLYSR